MSDLAEASEISGKSFDDICTYTHIHRQYTLYI